MDKPIQTDDALFVWAGQWIQMHPLNFYGEHVNWWYSTIPMWKANQNPPLMPYYLAGAATFLGWSDIALHIACMVLAFAAAAGIYQLAKMWCGRPLLATIIAIFTPAFLVSSTTLMCDVLMLALWVWALVFWDRALTGASGRWFLVVAGVLAGLAMLSKYSAVFLMPLMGVLGIARTRKIGVWLLALLVPLAIMGAYEWITTRLYGQGLFSMAGHYAQTHRFIFPGRWKAGIIIGLAFAGGSLLPVLFYAPLLWRWWAWLTGGIIIFGGVVGLFWLGGDPGLIHPWFHPEVWTHWSFRLQVAALAMAGVNILLLVGIEAWQQRNAVCLTLVFWFGGIFFFAGVLNWTINARSFLPAAPAIAILAVRRLDRVRGKIKTPAWLLVPMAPAVAVTVLVSTADYQEAKSVQRGAEKFVADYQGPDHNLWFQGHGGFQYYLQKHGAQPIDVEKSVLKPGDYVAMKAGGETYVALPEGSSVMIDIVPDKVKSWINLSGPRGKSVAGFYEANNGPVPFAFDQGQVGVLYSVAKLSCYLQFMAEAANPKEVLAGAVPEYPKVMTRKYAPGSQGNDIQQLLPQAQAGDAGAQFNLGVVYYSQNDSEDAMVWFRRAAEQGYDDAQNNLGLLLATVKHDTTEGVYWLTQAANLGNANAENNLGAYYLDGIGVKQDPVLSAQYFARAAEQGHVEAQSALGQMYLNGKGVKADKEVAYKWLKIAFVQGDTNVEHDLGTVTASMSKEQIAAAEEMIKSQIKFQQLVSTAREGDSQAQNNVGVEYQSIKDYDDALIWYRMAARQGNAIAQNNLGVIYQNKNDYDDALIWYRKAAEQGSSVAQNNIGVLLTSVKKDYIGAVSWFNKAATLGNADAQNNLGIYYMSGIGGKPDFETAAKFFLMSAQKGNPGGQKGLGKLYQNDKWEKADKVQAYRWLKMAALQGDEEAEDNSITLAASMTSDQIAAANKLVQSQRASPK